MPTTIEDVTDPPQHRGQENVLTYYWDVGTLRWIRGVQVGGVGSATVLNGVQVKSVGDVWTDVGYAGGNLTVPVSTTQRFDVSTKLALTAAAPTVASVGVASAQVIAANTSRKGLVFVNTSANRISFGVGQAAVLDSGITLYPAGTWVMDEYTFSTAAINAIASAASSGLAIQEFS